MWEVSFWSFFFLTVIIGGGTAYLTGRAIAKTWRPFAQAVGYTLLLAAAVRFFHFSLLEGTLLSLKYYVIDGAVLLLAAGLGYRIMRAWQMAHQYGWAFRRAGPFGWARASQGDSAA